MDPVREQYETLPYPFRDPADESKRLIATTPSEPAEIDHYLFRGRRDWSKPFRVLSAGGGTGDATVNMAQRLADGGCPAEIHYLDMSTASRAIAEARIKARGLDNVTFHTGDLLTAPDLGQFDYIDCCGVLHHLPDPDAGFQALASALAPGGGMGIMVYALHGRSGVYQLQDAFRRMLPDNLAPGETLRLAKSIMEALPDSNLLKRNPYLSAWRIDDTEFYDLLLHSRDRAYTVEQLDKTLKAVGLEIVEFPYSALYDPVGFIGAEQRPLLDTMSKLERYALGELLRGDITKHTFYAASKEETDGRVATGKEANAVPRFKVTSTEFIAREIADHGRILADVGAIRFTLSVPHETALAVAVAGDGRSLGEMADLLGLDWMQFQSIWRPIHNVATATGLLTYSQGMDCQLAGTASAIEVG